MDLWQEVKKKWLVLGVLAAVTLAVISPDAGAPGGVLRAEYLWFLPHSYICYKAGQHWARPNARLFRVATLAVCHSYAVTPAVCLFTVYWFRERASLDIRLLQGAIFASMGGPCIWLSLSLSQSNAAAVILALNHLASVLLAPLVTLLLCGRAALPPHSGAVGATLATIASYVAGASRHTEQLPSPHGRRLAALPLLYFQCCDLLTEAEGTLYVSDVIVTLVLEILVLCGSAGACCAYSRCGVLSDADCFTLILCAVPKSLYNGWSNVPCSAWGLSRLPAVFLAPAQALLLAALTDASDAAEDEEEVEDDAGAHRSLLPHYME